MEDPFISVILDNYNYASYISQAVESVLNQTYPCYELILVDDGSTDGSAELIQSYALKYPQIKTVIKQNGGQMSAFNAGMAAVSGDLVAFLDSDDYWFPHKLERIASLHKTGFRVVQHYLSNNGNGIYRKTRADVDWHRVLVKYGYLFNHSVCSSLSFDRALIAPFFPMEHPEEMRYCADGVVFMMALSKAPLGRLEEVLGFYRQHGKNGFVNKDDTGEKARKILKKQQSYVNTQLNRLGYAKIPFDPYTYFRDVIHQELNSGRIKHGERVLLYGTESSGLYLTQVLEEAGITVTGYADSSVRKWNREFCGREIWGPHDLAYARSRFNHILIASSAQEEIAATLKALGFVEYKDYISLPI